MNEERKAALLSSFVYSEEAIPRNYGRLIPLGRFLEEVEDGHHKPFMGTGDLVLDGKFIEKSETWVSERCVPFENGSISLWQLNDEIEGLQVFWVTATELLS